VVCRCYVFFFFFSSRRRHTRSYGDWSSDVCSSDLALDIDSGRLTVRAGEHALQPSAVDIQGCDLAASEVPDDERIIRDAEAARQIGRASCRERGDISEVARAWQERTWVRRAVQAQR